MSKLTKKLGLENNATEVDIINAITAIQKDLTDEINQLKSVVPSDMEATVKALKDEFLTEMDALKAEHTNALKGKDDEIEALKKQVGEPAAEGINLEAKKAAAKTRELHPELKDTALFVTEDLLTFINIGDAIAHMKSEKHQTQPVEC